MSAIRDFGGIGLRFTLRKKGLIIGSGPALEIKQQNGKVLVMNISKRSRSNGSRKPILFIIEIMRNHWLILWIGFQFLGFLMPS